MYVCNKNYAEFILLQVTCNACNLTFNSELQAAQHYNGSRHAKKVRLMEAAKQMDTEEDPAETDTNGEKLPSSGVYIKAFSV